METKVKRREWVKTFAIVFLSILLVLTFFSNTIMNHSLPEVAAQYTQSGSINAKIRGTGTVSANEVYEVSLSQTRKVRSVLVKVGQEVTAGDALLQLESTESEELKAAQEQLDSMELSYQKSLIESSNAASTEDRQIQKLRETYEEALRIYNIYSYMDPSKITLAHKDAEASLSILQTRKEELQRDLEKEKTALAELETTYSAYLGRVDTIDKEIADYEMKLDSIEAALNVLKSDKSDKQNDYDAFEKFVLKNNPGNAANAMESYANNKYDLEKALESSGESNAASKAERYSKAYDVLTTDVETLCALLDNAPTITQETSFNTIYQTVTDAAYSQKNTTAQNLKLAKAEQEKIADAADAVTTQKDKVTVLEADVERASDDVSSQEKLVQQYADAASAAATLEAAEEALEDALFQASLSDSSSLDMQAAKDAIEQQKLLVEELTKDADGQEITASVSGVISAINVTAGGTAAAESPVITITVADRGYTVKVSVTNDQARQVKIGDTAQITNYYWGDITATLENIVSDPSSQGQGKMLVFRLSGDGVEAGTNLTLSIGQRSANYDCLVPNSAIRSDSNGNFVLVVTSKSSPLGNRYVATRADVQVLASDDTTSAVSGIANGDFVITTSSKPLEAGDMVRLPDNG